MNSYSTEQSVLGAVMISPQAIEKVTEHLDGSEFTTDAHRELWGAIMALRADRITPDVVTVGERVGKDLAGYAIEVSANTPSVANVESYAKMLRDDADLRRIREIGSELATFQGKGSDAIEHAQSRIAALTMRREQSGLQHVNVFVNQAIDHMARLFESDSHLLGESWGLTDLDNLTSGLQGGQLWIVAGRPGMGKSILASNAAESIATSKPDQTIAFFQLEMPGTEMVTRMGSSLSRMDFGTVRDPKLLESRGGWPKLTQAWKEIGKTNFMISDVPALTADQIRIRARQAHHKNPLALIVVDYLQLIRLPGKGNKADELGEVTASFKRLAKELDVPVIALSQLNRGCENRPNKRPVLADLRDSGSIEADADGVICIYRDEVYDEDSKDKGIAELLIRKQRSGSLGTVRVSAALARMRFDDLTRASFEAMQQ